MTRPDPARRRFVAALFLFFAWVGVLLTMALTSSYRPPEHLHRTAADSPVEDPHAG